MYHLPKLNAAVRQAVEQYSGAVFPKLNWTSPKVSRGYITLIPVTLTGMIGRRFHPPPSVLRAIMLLFPCGHIPTPQI